MPGGAGSPGDPRSVLPSGRGAPKGFPQPKRQPRLFSWDKTHGASQQRVWLAPGMMHMWMSTPVWVQDHSNVPPMADPPMAPSVHAGHPPDTL